MFYNCAREVHLCADQFTSITLLVGVCAKNAAPAFGFQPPQLALDSCDCRSRFVERETSHSSSMYVILVLRVSLNPLKKNKNKVRYMWEEQVVIAWVFLSLPCMIHPLYTLVSKYTILTLRTKSSISQRLNKKAYSNPQWLASLGQKTHTSPRIISLALVLKCTILSLRAQNSTLL